MVRHHCWPASLSKKQPATVILSVVIAALCAGITESKDPRDGLEWRKRVKASLRWRVIEIPRKACASASGHGILRLREKFAPRTSHSAQDDKK